MTTDQWCALVWVFISLVQAPVLYWEARKYYFIRKPWFYHESAIVWSVVFWWLAPLALCAFYRLNSTMRATV